jgi:hypothetical protein
MTAVDSICRGRRALAFVHHEAFADPHNQIVPSYHTEITDFGLQTDYWSTVSNYPKALQQVEGYMFYRYGNSAIPNGDAGWRIETAPTPMQCSIQYTYNGTGVPVVKLNTSGC